MTTWIITADENIAGILESARSLPGPVVAVVVGDAEIAGVDSVVRIPCAHDIPVEALAPVVATQVNACAGEYVLAANRSGERVLAGAVAARLHAPVFTNVVEITAGQAKIAVSGGISEETISCEGPAVFILDGGEPSVGSESSSIVSGQAHPARIVSTDLSAHARVNLAAADRIVAAGRGFQAEEDLDLAKELCGAIGAELACSRPLSEGTHWMGRDTYIGVSGQYVAPELYFAIGISGQVQHTVGIADSKVIVAINDDETAPIFQYADYGIVGDLYTVLPALNALLK